MKSPSLCSLVKYYITIIRCISHIVNELDFMCNSLLSAGYLAVWHMGRSWTYWAILARASQGTALKSEVKLEKTKSWRVCLSGAGISKRRFSVNW